MVAAHPRLKPGDQLAVHVEQGQAAENDARRSLSFEHLRSGPGVEHLVPVRAHRNLRRACRAAGADIGGYVVAADLAARDETVGGLLAHRIPQIDDLEACVRRSHLNQSASGLSLLGVEVISHVDERDRREVWKRGHLCGQDRPRFRVQGRR